MDVCDRAFPVLEGVHGIPLACGREALPFIEQDCELVDGVAWAVAELKACLGAQVPGFRDPVLRWMEALAPEGSLEAYFLHPMAFPHLALPWWLARALGGRVDGPTLARLTYSSLCGYYFIRLIDEAMDEREGARLEARGETALSLLPALAFFQVHFQRFYLDAFSGSPSFWELFERTWVQGAQAALLEPGLPDIDRARFWEVSARKVAAGKIPLAAVALASGLETLPAPWESLFDLLGAWHQMHNDLFDWQRDHRLGRRTYVLDEARRRRPGDGDPAPWIMEEGFTWAADQLDGWMSTLLAMSTGCGLEEVHAYLRFRQQRFLEQRAEVEAGFRAFSRVLRAARATP